MLICLFCRTYKANQKMKKKPIEDLYLQNGHSPQMKTDSRNRSNMKNSKKYEDYIEKVHKPVKIVQEDIRPSIPKENREEKDGKHGKDSRFILFSFVFLSFCYY